eukprot:1180568-Prorocentrum_minimum.AAC.3
MGGREGEPGWEGALGVGWCGGERGLTWSEVRDTTLTVYSAEGTFSHGLHRHVYPCGQSSLALSHLQPTATPQSDRGAVEKQRERSPAALLTGGDHRRGQGHGRAPAGDLLARLFDEAHRAHHHGAGIPSFDDALVVLVDPPAQPPPHP